MTYFNQYDFFELIWYLKLKDNSTIEHTRYYIKQCNAGIVLHLELNHTTYDRAQPVSKLQWGCIKVPVKYVNKYIETFYSLLLDTQKAVACREALLPFYMKNFFRQLYNNIKKVM